MIIIPEKTETAGGIEHKGTKKTEIRKDPADMKEKEKLIQGLSDAGCGAEIAAAIGELYEKGSYPEMLHQMKKQRCMLMDQMHECQRRVDRIDFLIRNQEKLVK